MVETAREMAMHIARDIVVAWLSNPANPMSVVGHVLAGKEATKTGEFIGEVYKEIFNAIDRTRKSPDD